MSRFFFPAGVLLLALSATAGVAQSNQDVEATRSGDAAMRVASFGESAVLIRETDGKTWVLRQSEDSSELPAWIPIKLLDEQAAITWLQKEPKRRRLVRHRENLEQFIDSGLDKLNPDHFEQLEKKIAELVTELGD